MQIIKYRGLEIALNKDDIADCNFLIGDIVYYVINKKIKGFEHTNLIINSISKEYVEKISETPFCEKDLIKIVKYCKTNKLAFSYPLGVVLKNPELNRLIHIDANGRIRSYYELVTLPKNLILKMPELKTMEVSLDTIIQAQL